MGGNYHPFKAVRGEQNEMEYYFYNFIVNKMGHNNPQLAR